MSIKTFALNQIGVIFRIRFINWNDPLNPVPLDLSTANAIIVFEFKDPDGTIITANGVRTNNPFTDGKTHYDNTSVEFATIKPTGKAGNWWYRAKATFSDGDVIPSWPWIPYKVSES